jgi:hypothetical protein
MRGGHGAHAESASTLPITALGSFWTFCDSYFQMARRDPARAVEGTRSARNRDFIKGEGTNVF